MNPPDRSSSLKRTLSYLASSPHRPAGVEPERKKGRVGVDYDTSWARRYPVRVARAMVLDDLTVPVVRALSRPRLYGRDGLERLEGPVIIAANHSSHLDTPLLLSALPPSRRHRTVVAAAADYFFDRQWKAALSAFSLGAIPMERVKVNRRSAEVAAGLIEDGWSLVIFPEGGRSPHGWGQEFKGGAAYLAKRCGVPVVPLHIRGTRAILPRDGDGVTSKLRPGRTELRFGAALYPREGEDARKFSARIEAAVALLADEAETDYWSARLAAGRDASPPFRGPQAAGWRRAWALPPSADPASRRPVASERQGIWRHGPDGS